MRALGGAAGTLPGGLIHRDSILPAGLFRWGTLTRVGRRRRARRRESRKHNRNPKVSRSEPFAPADILLPRSCARAPRTPRAPRRGRPFCPRPQGAGGDGGLLRPPPLPRPLAPRGSICLFARWQLPPQMGKRKAAAPLPGQRRLEAFGFKVAKVPVLARGGGSAAAASAVMRRRSGIVARL